MKERPILFSGPMVNALLAGRKTQTRRALRDQDPIDLGASEHGAHLARRPVHDRGRSVGQRLAHVHCPYGEPGGLLWVRETHARAGCKTNCGHLGCHTIYRADEIKALGAYGAVKWTTSIHMPRWASRISLYITGVRVERLQDISDTDAKAEGIEPFGDGWKHYFFPDEPHAAWEFATNSYASLWEKINGAGSWDSNPWVWVLEFHVVQPCTASGVPVASQIARQP